MLTGPPPKFHGTRDILKTHVQKSLARCRADTDLKSCCEYLE